MTRQSMARLVRSRQVQVALAILGVAVSFAFLGGALYANWQELSQYPWRANVGYLLAVFALYPVALSLVIWVWNAMMGRLAGYGNLRRNAENYCTANLVSYIPGRIWHLAGRAYLNERQGVPRSASLLGLSLEIVLHSLSGVLVYLLLQPFYASSDVLKADVLVVLVVPLALFIANPNWLYRLVAYLARRLGRKRPSLPPLRRRDVTTWLLAYALTWFDAGLMLYLLLRGIAAADPIPLPTLIGMWALVGALGYLTAFLPLPNGLWIKEITLALLLSAYIPLATGIVVSLLFRVVLLVGNGFWSAAFVIICRSMPRWNHLVTLRRSTAEPKSLSVGGTRDSSSLGSSDLS